MCVSGYPIVIGLMKANGLKVDTSFCPAAPLIGDISSVKDAAKLDFSGLPITSLPEGVFDLSLKSLDIGYCKKLPLDVIDTICQKMPQLESLRLAALEMTTLPKEIGSLQKLEKLILWNCSSLKSLPSEIGNLQSLTELNCGNCSSLKSK